MRQLVPIFLLMATFTTAACAQDPATPQPPRTTQPRSGGDYGYGGPPSVKAAAVDDSVQVSRLLSEAKMQAFQLREDAAILESFTRAQVNWESRGEAIARMRKDVNTMGRELTKLDEARNTASSWQKEAIDRMTPLVKELASNTAAVVEHFNRGKTASANVYKNYLEANLDMASHLASLTAEFVNYGKAKERLEHMTF